MLNVIGARFAPEKYELMHFTRRRTRHNRAAAVQIGPRVIEPTGAMRVLGVWLDPALHWKSHLDAVAGKMRTQLRALTCLSASTWGLPLAQARMMYGMVIRPAVTYGAIAWHQPRGHDCDGLVKLIYVSAVSSLRLGNPSLLPFSVAVILYECAHKGDRDNDRFNRGLNGALAPYQNQCLRVITGAYRAAPASTLLEAEAHVPPLNLYLVSMVARSVPGGLPLPTDAWPEPAEALHQVHPPPAIAPGVAV